MKRLNIVLYPFSNYLVAIALTISEWLSNEQIIYWVHSNLTDILIIIVFIVIFWLICSTPFYKNLLHLSISRCNVHFKKIRWKQLNESVITIHETISTPNNTCRVHMDKTTCISFTSLKSLYFLISFYHVVISQFSYIYQQLFLYLSSNS